MSGTTSEALEALRAMDRRTRPLTDAVRDRVERGMLAAYAEAAWEDESGSDSDTSVVHLAAVDRDEDQRHVRPWGRRLLVAAAAIAALGMAATIGVLRDRDDAVEVAGVEDDEMNTQVVAAVRAWCPDGLSDLTVALGDLETDASRRAALSEAAIAAEAFSIL